MEYKIIIASKARSEIESIFDYINEELKNNNAAVRLKNKFKENIRGLKKMPKRYPEIEKRDKLKRFYRRIVVDNYVILFTIDDEKKSVYVAHVYYGRKNYM